MRALIVGDDPTVAALAGARALAAAGWTVGIGSPTRYGLAARSRASCRWHPVLLGTQGVGAFVDGVRAAVRAGGYQLVFGTDDAEVVALSEHRDSLGAAVPYAAHEVVLRAFDKLELVRLGDAAGLRSPRTVSATDQALAQWSDGAIVKPRSHAGPGGWIDPAPRVESSLVRDAAGLAERAGDIRAGGGQPLLQEVIRGPLTAFVAVSDRGGRLIACAQQVAERIYPPDAGVTVRGRSLPVDAGLRDSVSRLLEALGWFGLAQLQFVLASDGEPRLIDFNGRFYGSLALAVAAGPNLPAIWAALAMGEESRGPLVGRAGVRYQRFAGDLRAGWMDGRSGALRELCGSTLRAGRSTHGVWKVSDPLPTLTRVARVARALPRRWSA